MINPIWLVPTAAAGLVLGSWFARRRIRSVGIAASESPASEPWIGGVSHGLRNSAAVLGGNVARARRQNGAAPFRDVLDAIELATEEIVDQAWLLDVLSESADPSRQPIEIAGALRRAFDVIDHAVPASCQVRFDPVGRTDIWILGDANELLKLLALFVHDARRSLGDHLTVIGSITGLADSDHVQCEVRVEVNGQTATVDSAGALELARRMGTGVQGNPLRMSFPSVPTNGGGDGMFRGPRGAGQSVLIAEDDRQIRSLLASMLVAEGFSPIQAGDGQDALDKFREFGESIHYVILDLNMPRMNGVECIPKLRALSRDVPILIVSGRANHDDVPDDVDVLTKPFQMDELTQRVRDAVLTKPEES